MWAFWRLLSGRQVVVNLRPEPGQLSGPAIAGVLTRRIGPLLELRNATIHAPNQETVKVDGTVVVERDRVLFVQRIGE